MGMQTDFYIFTLLISNSWDTETNLVQIPLLIIDCVMSVLAGKTEGFVVTPVTSGIVLTVRFCPQLFMESTLNH